MGNGVRTKKSRHPQKMKLSAAIAEELEAIKSRKGKIDKRATYFHSAEAPGEGTGGFAGTESFRPTDEQLSRINQFTMTPKSADEVACFPTYSCNDLEDRDEDKFTTDCIKEFAELPQPYSPVGKSYMLDHNYSVQNAVGRIFGVGTEKVSAEPESFTSLTNEVYIPNTERHAGLLEDIDFGIAWAVSVGVVLGKDQCSLSFCDAGFSRWGYWCLNGHDKGAYYLKDAEEDAWGFPMPVDSRTAGAEKCIRLFMDPKDFYELSQVFLGAQYHAQLADKDPEFAGILKAASAGGGNVPIIGLKRDEAKKLPKLRHVPEKLADAYVQYEVEVDKDDGSLTWVDEQKLLWIFDPMDPESGVQCLGRASKTEEDDTDEEVDEDGEEGLHEHASGDSDSAVEQEGDALSDDGGESGQDGDSEASSVEPLGGGEGSSGEHLTADDEESEDEEDDSEDDESEEEESEDSDEEEVEQEGVTARTVLAAAVKADLPQDILTALANAEGHGLGALLTACSVKIKSLQEDNRKLSGQAKKGEQLLTETRADAIEWFCKANAPAEGGPVKTAEFEALLDRCGDDVELIRSLGQREKQVAQARFGRKTTRRSFGKDPHERVDAAVDNSDEEHKSPWEDEHQKRADEAVTRLHG